MAINLPGISFRRELLLPLLSLLPVAALVAATAQAEYRDPIDLKAQSIESAEHSLLLDIDRAGDRLVAVGERGHILLSDDNGRSWRQAEVPTRAHLNALTFTDADHGWAVGEDAVIVHTRDGGEHWQRQFDDRDADQKGPLLDVWFRNPREGLAIGVFNKLLHTVDGGRSWQPGQDRLDNPDEWHLISFAATTDQRLYISSEMGLLFRSLDGGDSFQPLQTDHDGSFHGILARAGDDGADQLVAMGVGGVLYTSVDSGDSWHRVDTATEAGLAGGSWLADGRALIVGADGIVLILDHDLRSAEKHQTENGMPLASVVSTAGGAPVAVGLAGIQPLRQEQ